MMKKIGFVAIGLMLMIGLPQMVFAWGALAIDGDKLEHYGWAIDYPTYDKATKKALKECGDKCYIVMTFNGGAAAYAADQHKQSTAYGWGRADTAAVAKEKALEYCKQFGGSANDCIVRAWGQESQKRKTSEQANIKVFTTLNIHPDKTKADVVWIVYYGWTYVSPQELSKYAQLDVVPSNAKDAIGERKKATFLITPGTLASKYSRGEYNNIENSPIMQRFEKLVLNDPNFSKRNQSKQKGVQFQPYKPKPNQWHYKGYHAVVDDVWSLENLKKALLNYQLKTPHSFIMVNLGEF